MPHGVRRRRRHPRAQNTAFPGESVNERQGQGDTRPVRVGRPVVDQTTRRRWRRPSSTPRTPSAASSSSAGPPSSAGSAPRSWPPRWSSRCRRAPARGPPAPRSRPTSDKLAPGQLLTVEWRGKPVWVVRRTDEALAASGCRRGQAVRSGFRDRAATGVRAEPDAIDRTGVPRRRRRLHAPRLLPDLPPRDRPARSRIGLGRRASSVLVTVRGSIWPGASTRASRHRPISRSHPTASPTTARSSSARIPEGGTAA